jgi:hypothetical protein
MGEQRHAIVHKGLENATRVGGWRLEAVCWKSGTEIFTQMPTPTCRN